MRLQSFHGTELENNPSLSDYHGFFHLTKLAAINTLVSKHPGSIEYAFKLRRKKFCIEILHLPPGKVFKIKNSFGAYRTGVLDIEDKKEEKGGNFVGCGGQKSLDF